MGEITLYGNLRDADLERSGSGHAGVVHLGQSTCHAISGRGGVVNNTGIGACAAGERGGINSNGCEDFRPENGSSQGRNLALTCSFVPSPWLLRMPCGRTYCQMLPFQ